MANTNVVLGPNTRSSSIGIDSSPLRPTDGTSNLLNSTSSFSLSGGAAATVTQGLTGQYYKGKNFNTLLKTRIDPTVNFNWGAASPEPTVLPIDNFSVRWSGQIQPAYSETYTFYTTSDDGVRLWVNGQLLVNNWTPHGVTENSNTIRLMAGQKYDLKLEYYDNGGGGVSTLSWSSPSQAKQIIPQSQLFAASVVGETAKTAYSFVDSIGVNTHLRYYDTAYGNFSLIAQRLRELGIHHIRDGGSDLTWIRNINALAASGIKTTLVIDPNIGVGPTPSYNIKPPGYTIVNLLKNKLPNAVEAVEILNEFDIIYPTGYSYNGQSVTNTNWVSYLRSFTQDTYTALKNDPATQAVGIIGPSFVYPDSSTLVGDLSQWVDYGNLHPYTNPKNPEDANLVQDIVNRSKPFGTRPLIATETGYFTNVPSSNRSVSETVQGKYMPRLFLENYNQGITRTFSYELIDERSNSTNGEDNYGLLRADGSPKPAFTALKNLISLLNDPSTTSATFTPGALNYSLSNAQNVDHTLLQKSNGDFYLVLWQGVPSTDQTVNKSVTLNLATPIAQATTFLPNQSLTSTGQYATPTQITLNVPDYPLVIQLKPSQPPGSA
ncbi:MAG: PA14 domain-containing protein [Kovacikia sp.]